MESNRRFNATCYSITHGDRARLTCPFDVRELTVEQSDWSDVSSLFRADLLSDAGTEARARNRRNSENPNVLAISRAWCN